jgi:hypothetical protein
MERNASGHVTADPQNRHPNPLPRQETTSKTLANVTRGGASRPSRRPSWQAEAQRLATELDARQRDIEELEDDIGTAVRDVTEAVQRELEAFQLLEKEKEVRCWPGVLVPGRCWSLLFVSFLARLRGGGVCLPFNFFSSVHRNHLNYYY